MKKLNLNIAAGIFVVVVSNISFCSLVYEGRVPNIETALWSNLLAVIVGFSFIQTGVAARSGKKIAELEKRIQQLEQSKPIPKQD